MFHTSLPFQLAVHHVLTVIESFSRPTAAFAAMHYLVKHIYFIVFYISPLALDALVQMYTVCIPVRHYWNKFYTEH